MAAQDKRDQAKLHTRGQGDNIVPLTLTPLDEGAFYATLAATPGISVVFFTAPVCGACRRWRALLEHYGRRHAGVTVFEVDCGMNMGLAREYEVMHLPALFVFIDGRFHAPLQCEASPEGLMAALDRVLAAPALEAP